MVAGGFRTFVAGETLDEDKINDFLMQGVLVFEDAAARDSAITNPVHGQIAFLKDADETLFYDGTDWVALSLGTEVEYLVVAGGGNGAGTNSFGAGGGAGGARSSVPGDDSGGGASAEPFLISTGDPLPLTVGAGGASAAVRRNAGSPTIFGFVVAVGGGGGGFGALTEGGLGGCGGGSHSDTVAGGAGTPFQGFKGGDGGTGSGTGGGGGAGGAGADSTGSSNAGVGGVGVISTILTTSAATSLGVGEVSGSDVYFAGGGGATQATGSSGGLGGGGNGSGINGPINSGAPNSGGGGGARYTSSSNLPGGAGGSGVVIFRVPTTVSVSFSAGVTHDTEVVGTNTTYVVTAAGPTDTVTIG